MIHTSEPYPGVPLICHKDETDRFISEMRCLFSSFRPDDSAQRHHFNKGAQPATDADYNPVRYLRNIVLGTDYKIN